MDINFPLILLILVVASGCGVLYDRLVLLKPRRSARAAVEAQFAGELDQSQQQAKELALSQVNKEPGWVEYSKSFFPVLAIVFVLRSFLYEPFQIPSPSMVPTLQIGDFILVNKFTYGVRLPVARSKVLEVNQPKRGDVMVFFPPHKKIYYIKRVIGLPGDEIRYINNVLYINGEKQEQNFVAALPAGNPSYKVMDESVDDVTFRTHKMIQAGPLSRNFSMVVPEGHYFMMGDNRDHSSDSRDWGAVPEENIVGKAVAIWMHWDSFFSIPSFSRVGAI